MLSVPAAIAFADAGDLPAAQRHLDLADRSATLWSGTAWQAAVLEARAHLTHAEGDATTAAAILHRAAELFASLGHPLDALRCRRPIQHIVVLPDQRASVDASAPVA
jgi:hypothetical protein